jgi:uncharacterized phiE125 gp8 family phage protein
VLIQTSPPVSEPISRADAKTHLKVDITDDDLLIDDLITAARQYAESETRRSLITQSWRLVLDSWPGPATLGVPWGRTYSLRSDAILLEMGTVQSVVSITYLALDGTTQTVAAADYIADLSCPLTRITPTFGKIWPANVMPQIGSVKVDYTAGYGGAGAVPSGIRRWMLLRIGALYENREEIVVGRGITANQLSIADSLLDPFRIVTA